MKLHNTVEDTVISRVEEVFEDIKKDGNPGKLCFCEQCRMDTICYALNRMPPYYIVSNRGVAQVQWETIERQQHEADITALVHEGLKRVNHNQRPHFTHSAKDNAPGPNEQVPVFNIPTIVGRLFNGSNFAPLSGVDVELLRNGELVPMKDANWQNPCHIVSRAEGSYSFWPIAVEASQVGDHKIFEYSLKVSVPEFDPLIHFFKIPVASETQTSGSFSLKRTHKLPDIYLFPPGEAEQNG